MSDATGPLARVLLVLVSAAAAWCCGAGGRTAVTEASVATASPVEQSAEPLVTGPGPAEGQQGGATCLPVEVCQPPAGIADQLPPLLAAALDDDPGAFVAASESYLAARRAELLAPDAASSDAWRAARLETHEAYVFDDTPVLAVGQAGYVTAEPWTLAVVSAALAADDMAAARRWLVHAGAPWDTTDTLDRCWLSLREAPASASEWSAVSATPPMVTWVEACSLEAPGRWRADW